MGQLPLTEGDFRLALSHAREKFVRVYFANFYDAPKAAREGIEALRELRGTRRLPSGVRPLQERIEACLQTTSKRRRYREVDPLLDKAPLAERYRDVVVGAVQSTFWRCDYRPCRLIVTLGVQATALGGLNVYAKSGECRVTVARSWWRTVYRRGIASALSDGTRVLVLSARETDPVEDTPCFLGAWLARGRGFEVHVVTGLVVGGAQPFVAASRRNAANRIRREAYRAHKREARRG